MPTYRYIMFTNPAAGREDEFNHWYDNVHIPDIEKSGAFTSGQRYKVMDSSHTPPGEHRYAAIYEVDGEDPDAALNKLVAAFQSGDMRMSDAMDMTAGRPILLQAMDVKFGG
jgi:hypothetical protein